MPDSARAVPSSFSMILTAVPASVPGPQDYIPVLWAQVSGVLHFPALTSGGLCFRRCKCLRLPTTCHI